MVLDAAISAPARKIFLAVRKVSPEIAVTELAKEAARVVTDRGYLKIQRQWRQNIAKKINCLFVQGESDVIIPVEEASVKEEYAAATFRSKILSKINYFLIPPQEELPILSSLTWQSETLPIEDTEQTIKQLKIDRSVPKANFFSGGTATAKILLEAFIS